MYLYLSTEVVQGRCLVNIQNLAFENTRYLAKVRLHLLVEISDGALIDSSGPNFENF